MMVESAGQFAKTLRKAENIFIGFVDAVPATCNFIHRAAHGDVTSKTVNVDSERILDEMERTYPVVFAEPTYPITENRVPFKIPLVDEKKPPPRRNLYPLSEPELTELRA